LKQIQHKFFGKTVIETKFEKNSDNIIISDLLEEAWDLCQKVNPKAANESRSRRTQDRLYDNAILGVAAEIGWRSYLNREQMLVNKTAYLGTENQIDLKIAATQKTIEVRASMIRNGAEFAASKSYLIGPYANYYKKAENIKDYYLGAIIHFDNRFTPFNEIAKNFDFSVFLMGGATKEMISDDSIAETLGMNAGDIKSGETHYRAVSYLKTLDAKAIYKAILSEK
jgi:hypothetical protein